MLVIIYETPMPVNVEMIIKAVNDTLELNAFPKEEINEKVKSSPTVKSLLDSGGFMAIAIVPIVILVLLVFLALYFLKKKYPEKLE
jgi:hypothetical protein